MYESHKSPSLQHLHGLNRFVNGATKNDSFQIKEEGAGNLLAERGCSESLNKRLMKHLEKEAHQESKQLSKIEGTYADLNLNKGSSQSMKTCANSPENVHLHQTQLRANGLSSSSLNSSIG